MRERFLDIVTLIARYMFEEGRGTEDEQAITDALVAEGYERRDVQEAFEWLEQVAAARAGRPDDRAPDDGAARVLTPAEQLKINPQAFGFLIRLRQLGLADTLALERILERAMGVDTDEIGLDEVRAIAALVIFDKGPQEVHGHLLNAAEERRERVYH
jgi:Smg protein